MVAAAELGKVEIVRGLANAFGYTRYLEITTTTTGLRYAEARKAGYALCERIVYRQQNAHSDGLPVDYSSQNDDISVPLARIRELGREYDAILVDAHHTYDCSARDLKEAFAFLRTGGALVVHDCDPRSKEIARSASLSMTPTLVRQSLSFKRFELRSLSFWQEAEP